MNEFTNQIAYSKCCNAKAIINELQTVEIALTRSHDMVCSECNKEILPHEINWLSEYQKIDKGIYRKIIHQKLTK